MALQEHDSAESIHEERRSYDHLEEEAPILMNIIPRESTFIRGANVTCQIIFLTLCLAGLQFTWTVEMAYGNCVH
ncbi:hypothetical protein RMATCC62417_11487 [Rhizopus microsporus]|nr:hypothetical protein RMATCC62417_11487 [Rhizopus microsporus]